MKSGLLVINLGTPSALNLLAIKRYLREFLSDKRVIDLPWLVRYFLVNALIVPFRAKKSLHAYQTIWSKEGAPLLFYSKQLEKKLQQEVMGTTTVVLSMRYGAPSIESALERLKDCTKITVLPLYPQYSSAATGSAIEKVINVIKKLQIIPSLDIIRDFYRHPAYVRAQTEIIKPFYTQDSFLLFSYHGIPERQLYKSGCKQICSAQCPLTEHEYCYRAQCFQTSHLIAQQLKLSPNQYSTSFQSHIGKTAWIKPYTDETLVTLANQGVKNITLCSPSFVADCLETLEELGIRAREQWTSLGGQQFVLIPSMNDNALWAKALLEITGLP